MTVTAVLFMPLVLLYQGWSFHVFRGRVSAPPASSETPPDAGQAAARARDRWPSTRAWFAGRGGAAAAGARHGAWDCDRRDGARGRQPAGADRRVGVPWHAAAALWHVHRLLAVVFIVRGGLAWGMEIAGRRAAWNVLSELRLALIDKRLRTQPLAVDGARSGELGLPRFRASRASRVTSPATCRRPCWHRSCH